MVSLVNSFMKCTASLHELGSDDTSSTTTRPAAVAVGFAARLLSSHCILVTPQVLRRWRAPWNKIQTEREVRGDASDEARDVTE